MSLFPREWPVLKLTRAVFAAAIVCIAGCTGSGESSTRDNSTSGPPSNTADISMLFMGNSHTSVNNLTGMVAEMMRAGMPGKSVAAVEAPGWMFLDERIHDAASLNLLASQDWSFVILQAQKYSSSGQFSYSTEEAKDFVRRSRLVHAVPVMFPEWPRLGIDETQRIYGLHVSIAQAEPACVPPIPQAFDLALQRHPSLVLHASDGNHSAPAGAFLAALILYATMSGRSPADLPNLPQFSIGAATQADLRAIAAETVQLVPPRQWCPNDPLPG